MKCKLKFNAVYSINILPKLKDRVWVINFGEYKSIGTHWLALYLNGDNVIYLDAFGVEYIVKKYKVHRKQKY